MTAFQAGCSSIDLGVPGGTIVVGVIAVDWARRTTRGNLDTLNAFWHMHV